MRISPKNGPPKVALVGAACVRFGATGFKPEMSVHAICVCVFVVYVVVVVGVCVCCDAHTHTHSERHGGARLIHGNLKIIYIVELLTCF